MSAHGRQVPKRKSKPKASVRTDSPHVPASTLAYIAKCVGVAGEHLALGAPPKHAPWSSPLDRVTYPREEVELTDAYIAWLNATVADVARHFEFAYRRASRTGDERADLFLPAARLLRSAAVFLAREDIDALNDYSPKTRAMKALDYVAVPTRLFVDRQPPHSCEGPFQIGGDVVLAKADGPRFLLYMLQSWIQTSACVTIADESARDRHIASQVAALLAGAELVPLVKKPLAPLAGKLAQAFRKDLREADVRWPETSDPSKRLLELGSGSWTSTLRTLALKFAFSLLMTAGDSAQEARATLDALRKEEDRAASKTRPLAARARLVKNRQGHTR